MLTLNSITTSKARLILAENNLLKIYIKENAELEKEDIIAINEAKEILAQGNKYCVVFVPPNNGFISKEARDFSASELVYKNAIAKAIIIKNVSQRLIGNFFINFNRPPAPTKLFHNEEEAIKWLEEMTAKNNLHRKN